MLTQQAPSMLDHALRYAELGLYVIPLHTPAGTACSCRKKDCTSIGKHPRTKNGLIDATVDEEKIRYWWGMWEDANIGIATGQSGLVVVDIDPRHGGDPDDLATTYGRDIFNTVTASTGGGGWHLVYRCPPGVPVANVNNSPRFTGPLGPGVDIRASGGYIVAPPSLHASGGVYDWDVDMSPFDRVPSRLPDGLLDVLVGPRVKPEEHERVDVAAILEGVPQGERDWQLFRMAAKLRGADVPIEWAYKLVGEAAAACTPPLPQGEARAKVDSAYNRYPAGQHAVVAPEDMRHAEGLEGRVLIDPIVREGAPPIEWLEEPILVRGNVTMIYGEPESGKTVFAAHWIRNAITNGLTALFIDEESGPYKIADFFRDMGAPDMDERLHYFPFLGIDMQQADALIAYAEDLRPDLIIFDSLTDMLASAGLDENSGIEVTKWMLAIPQRLARADWAPAVVLIDHIAKDAANTKYSVASRAKKAKSDALWLVEKQGDFDRTKTAPVDLFRHKNRPGVLPPSVQFVVGGRDGTLIVEPFDVLQHGITSLAAGARKIIAAIGEETLQNKEIRERTKYGDTHIANTCADLVKRKILEKVKVGAYDAYRKHRPVADDQQPVADVASPTFIGHSGPPYKGPVADGGAVADDEDPAWLRKAKEDGTWKG